MVIDMEVLPDMHLPLTPDWHVVWDIFSMFRIFNDANRSFVNRTPATSPTDPSNMTC
mgnify:CR=1 FL=1